MPGIKKRQNDGNINALVAAAEAGDVETLRTLLDIVDPNLQTAVRFRIIVSCVCSDENLLAVQC